MADQAEVTIATRFTRLNQLILGKSNGNVPKKYLAHRDSLLDVLFALYEECHADHFRRDKHISSFVDKFKSIMIELKSLRLNLQDFELKKIIGRGHFGEVQLVREKTSGDVYAMKVLHKQETLSQQSVAFFEEERDIMAKSTSSWLTKLQYAFQDNQNLYLVMEFHPGGDMISLLEKYDNVLPDEMCQFYLAELVLAIHSLHSMGYVHRDIKPGNILIDRTGHIKLADFGSSSKLNNLKQVISSMPVGTPDYVAPEVLTAMNGGSASSKSYGVECDWWSLGIVAYEMVFGSTPFADEKVLVTYNNIMNFKKSLNFPPESCEVSDKLIDLMTNLLTDPAHRLDYDKLIAHPLFTEINWNNIHHIRPPFVPTVSSVDDTSNFDEFEPETRLFMSELNRKKEFSGKDLPFVGFTYTSPFEAPIDKSSSSAEEDSLVLSPCSSLTEVDSNLRKCKMKSMEKEITYLVQLEKNLRDEIKKLNVGQLTKDSGIESVRAENLVLEQTVTHLKAEVKEMKQLLSYEREHRLIMEKKNVQIFRCMKSKRRESSSRLIAKSQEYHKRECEKLTMEEQLSYAFKKIDELLIEKNDLIEDLNDTQHLLLECQLKEQEKQLLLTSNENADTNNSSVNTCSTVNGDQVNIPSKLVSKLETKNVKLEREVETALHAKQEAERQVSALREANEKLGKELRQIKKESLEALSQDQGEKITNSIKKYEKELENKYFIIQDMQKKILSETETNAELKKKVQDFEKVLQSHKDSKKSMDMKVQELENKVSTMSKESSENSSSEADQSQVKPISWEKNAQNRSERQAQILLTSDLKQENDYLKSKNDQLSEEIKNIENLRKQLKEKEDALSEVKLDLRVSTRKEQQSESISSTLRERNKELREKLRASEEMVSTKTKIEDDLREKLNCLEGDISRLKDEITQIEKSREIEKAKLEERIKTLKDTWENSKDANHKFAKAQGQYEETLRQNADLAKENDVKDKKINEYVQENRTLRTELLKRKEDCSKYQKINGILKKTCLEMEEEIDEFKIAIERRQNSIAELTCELETLQEEMGKLKVDLKNRNINTENADKQKKELLKHIDELSAELNSQTMLHDAEIQDLQDTLTHFKKLVNELEVQTAQLQKQLALQDSDTKGYTGKIMSLESQLHDIKEEATRHITQISSLKTSNLLLTQELEDAVENQKEAKRSIEGLYNELESERAKNNHEKIKLRETISQQTKLIDFLQSKTENIEKKKKPMSRLFGKKDSNAPQMLPPRDVEKLLETERSRCRRLQDQLSQARVEREVMHKEISALTKSSTANAEIPVSPMSRAMHSAITFSPNAEPGKDSPVLTSKELLKSIIKPPGMKHKIPHRFVELMCMRSTKCCACLDSIHFGRPVEKCQECSIVCHPKCATSLPSTCGLPSGFMKHFKTVVQDSSSGDSADSIPGRSEGWIKVPKYIIDFDMKAGSATTPSKQGWDRRYLRLVSDVLYVFEDADETDEDKALAGFDFGAREAKLVVTSAVSATELPYAATSDIPYVLKIESVPYTTCWPERCLYIMTSNFNDKQMWVSVLERLAEKNISEVDGSPKNKLIGKTLWTLKSEKLIDPLCTTVFDENVILLGAVEGLFVLNIVNKFTCSLREKIEGFSYVYQVTCMRNIGIMVLIHGEDRKLSLVHLSDIQSNMYKSVKQSIALKQVAEVIDCHLFAIEEPISTTPYICIATADSLMLCQWDSTLKNFIPKKLIEANEPCSCILFTRQSIIFGANIFYELSLRDLNAKKFLDGTDASLAGLVYGASQFKSFPVAIFQVSPNEHYQEYLLCFHEMGVFVNSQGRRTRLEDMKWSRLPLYFAYQFPYLFITHFTSVEVIEIPPQNVSEQGIRSCMRVKNPQFMGLAHIAKSILVSSSQSGTVELIVVDGSSMGLSDFQQTSSDDSSVGYSETTSSTKESEENDVVDLDFSFTTSIHSTEEQTDDLTSLSSRYYSSESVGSQS